MPYKVILECGMLLPGLSETDRGLLSRLNVDLFVLDDAGRPLVAIELKHYSANQGEVDALCNNMRQDAARLSADWLQRHGVRLMEVGLYTAVMEVAYPCTVQHWKRNIGLYRFISSYCGAVFNANPGALTRTAAPVPPALLSARIKHAQNKNIVGLAPHTYYFDVPASSPNSSTHIARVWGAVGHTVVCDRQTEGC